VRNTKKRVHLVCLEPVYLILVKVDNHTAGSIETGASHIGNFGIAFCRGSEFTLVLQTVAQLLRKFPASYDGRRIILVFARVHRWVCFLSQMNPIHTLRSVTLRSSVLFYRLFLGLQGGFSH
jgi:hypothetical protein